MTKLDYLSNLIMREYSDNKKISITYFPNIKRLMIVELTRDIHGKIRDRIEKMYPDIYLTYYEFIRYDS